MTLNVAFTTGHHAYLSGDFRLTYGGGIFKDDLFTQKLIPIAKKNWCALMSFSGVARLSTGMDIGDWLREQVRPDLAHEPIDDLVVRLRKGNQWLSTLGSGDKRLTIVLVGFKRRWPFLLTLSNFQDLDGLSFKSVVPQLHNFETRPKRPQLRIFGDASSFSLRQRDELEKELVRQAGKPSALVCIAEASLDAASRSPGQTISNECVVGELHATGQGGIVPFGIDPAIEYIPNFVMAELNNAGLGGFKLRQGPDGQPMKPGLVQAGFKAKIVLGKPSLAWVWEFRNVDQMLPMATPNSNMYVAQRNLGENPKGRTVTIDYADNAAGAKDSLDVSLPMIPGQVMILKRK